MQFTFYTKEGTFGPAMEINTFLVADLKITATGSAYWFRLN